MDKSNDDRAETEHAGFDSPEFKDCVHCGETFEADDLNDDGRCATCEDNLDAQQEDDDSDYLCSDCNGSGEGMHDGTICWRCHGKGTMSSQY